MQVKFIGNQINPSDNRGFIIWAGERFDLNVPRELPEGKAFAKIPHNGHFEVVEDDEAKPETEPAYEEPTVNGMTKAELIAFAGENGVKIDKRWNIQKIADAIDEAAKAAESGE